MKFKQEVQKSGRKGSQDYSKSSYYPCHRRVIEPEREYSDSFRLTSSVKPTKLPSGFKPLRHQQISDKKSPYLPISGSIQERGRIIRKEQEFFQPEAERVGPYYKETFGPAERSTKKQQIVVNTFYEASSLRIKNNISTQMEHNSVTPEINLNSDQTWLKISQLVVKNQEKFYELHRSNLRLQELTILQEATVKAIQEICAKLSKSSEEKKSRLN
ncbi:hypothetical protein O181_030763 [Austropuccinia psidii MF-1]|uniref:Uncharacterized protein n=1 Tax=Austropuccinia psidii MF-1 TaxID=1389203 RepID=A0A9Q3H3Z3_9BASI|nr:hypothetical protein [Austropuccinia psidii MF-1]